MKSESWIKMGFRLIKLVILTGLIVVMLYSTQYTNKYSVIDNYDFSAELGISTVVTKKEEEKPKVEVKPSVLGANKYTGDLTGYAADCPACNGTLACKPKYDVYKNGVLTYPDETYGDVRIVASSKNLKCGSIIRFSSKAISSEPVTAIVLDRGVLGTDIDLLTPTEAYAYKYVGRRKITYEVLRYGW